MNNIMKFAKAMLPVGAAEKTKMILETHRIEPLPSEAETKIKEILSRAEKEILGKQC